MALLPTAKQPPITGQQNLAAFQLGVFSGLPKDLWVLILNLVHQQNLKLLCRTTKNNRVFVLLNTSWGQTEMVRRLFNSLVQGNPAIQQGPTYLFKTEQPGPNEDKFKKSYAELIPQPVTKLINTNSARKIIDEYILFQGYSYSHYKISENEFMGISHDTTNHSYWIPRFYRFKISNDSLTLTKKELPLLHDLHPAIYQVFDNRDTYFSVPEIYQIGNLVYLYGEIHPWMKSQPETNEHESSEESESSEKSKGSEKVDNIEKEEHYLFIYEIEPDPKISLYGLGKRKYALFYREEGEICYIEKQENNQTVKIKIKIQKNPEAILHVQGDWLLIRYCLTGDRRRFTLSWDDPEFNYIFYHIPTSKEAFCYTLVHEQKTKSAKKSKDCLIANTLLYEPRDVFIKDNFCILYHGLKKDKKRAELLLIDKRCSIPLSPETQELLCSFDRITDMTYQIVDKRIEMSIEGEIEFTKKKITVVNDLLTITPSSHPKQEAGIQRMVQRMKWVMPFQNNKSEKKRRDSQ